MVDFFRQHSSRLDEHRTWLRDVSAMCVLGLECLFLSTTGVSRLLSVRFSYLVWMKQFVRVIDFHDCASDDDDCTLLQSEFTMDPSPAAARLS